MGKDQANSSETPSLDKTKSLRMMTTRIKAAARRWPSDGGTDERLPESGPVPNRLVSCREAPRASMNGSPTHTSHALLLPFRNMTTTIRKQRL